MVARKGLLAPQNTFLDTIAARFDGTRKFLCFWLRQDLTEWQSVSAIVRPFGDIFRSLNLNLRTDEA